MYRGREVVTRQRTQSGFLRTKKLSLAFNQITVEGKKHLTTALTHTNCKLNSLKVTNNQITDERKTLHWQHSHTLTAKESKL